ncbi:MAG: DUF4189 domain-containing protein [Proteobacteria bacterium]|nr:DUF4189 domain-containing protein [Pseudomonadota bacterium]
MDNRVKLVAIAVLVIGAGVVAALVLNGVWPGPSAADRERSRLLAAQAQTQLRGGDQAAALRSLDSAIRAAPDDSALRARASIYSDRNNFDAAARDMDKLIGHGAATAADYGMRCWLRAHGDGLDGARTDCDRAIEMDPSLSSAYGSRGLVGLRQHRFREAWNDFNDALSKGGSDQWVAWRVFGRGVAAWGKGEAVQGRQDIEMALHANPAVAAQFAQFGVGQDIVRSFDDSTYAAASNPRSLVDLQVYLIVYPNGAHATGARAQINEILTSIAQSEAAGQRTVPGFSLGQSRGSGPQDDSFGAIAISRSTWHVAFATDYASAAEAELAAANACNSASVHDCDAYAFRNVCAALALSARERARGMAWSYGQDEAVEGAVDQCREHGGHACVPVHSQCTPTRANGVATAILP